MRCWAGALLPDALHGSAERVVVARAGLAHQPEHDRLALGLGHAAGTHRDGSSPSSARLVSSALHASSRHGRIKGTFAVRGSFRRGWLSGGRADRSGRHPICTLRRLRWCCRTADCCWVRPQPAACATSCGATTADGTCQARGWSPRSGCSSTRKQTPRFDATLELLSSPVARPAACACTPTARAGTTVSSGPEARPSSSSSCLRAVMQPGCRCERSTPAETRCGSTGGRARRRDPPRGCTTAAAPTRRSPSSGGRRRPARRPNQARAGPAHCT